MFVSLGCAGRAGGVTLTSAIVCSEYFSCVCFRYGVALAMLMLIVMFGIVGGRSARGWRGDAPADDELQAAHEVILPELPFTLYLLRRLSRSLSQS